MITKGMENVAADAASLNELSAQLARARARKQEAFTGMVIEQSTVAELTGIYHSATVRAWHRSGCVVALQDLYSSRKRGTINPYSFRVRLAWMRELKRAGSQAVAECYRTHKLHDEMASMSDLQALAEHYAKGHGKTATGDLTIDGPDYGCRRIRVREVRHARECLVTFWSLSGSRKAKSALASDLRLLARCLRVARGESPAILAPDGAGHGTAAHRAILRLRDRITAGDVLMTEQPEAQGTKQPANEIHAKDFTMYAISD